MVVGHSPRLALASDLHRLQPPGRVDGEHLLRHGVVQREREGLVQRLPRARRPDGVEHLLQVIGAQSTHFEGSDRVRPQPDVHRGPPLATGALLKLAVPPAVPCQPILDMGEDRRPVTRTKVDAVPHQHLAALLKSGGLGLERLGLILEPERLAAVLALLVLVAHGMSFAACAAVKSEWRLSP